MGINSKIGNYALYTYGRRSSGSRPFAQIYLYDDNGRYMGYVIFYKNSHSLPYNSADETANPKRAYLKMHERSLNTVVDMLRNEKPCNVYYRNRTSAFLYTGKEPVGEEESS